MRWFSMRALTTTSAPSSTSPSSRGPIAAARFEPSSSNCKRRTGRERGLGVGDGLERVVLDDDGFGRVGGGRPTRRDDDRDRVADEPHLLLARAAAARTAR